MKLGKTLLGIASLLLAASALHANPSPTVSFNATHTVSSGYVDFYLGKFDINLGTLTGVQITIVGSTMTGSILFTNNDVTSAEVASFDSTLTVRQAPSSELGYSIYGNTLYDVVTTPAWQGLTVAGESSQTFYIDANQSVATPNGNQDIASGNWAAYSSVGGTGTVNFQARDVQSIATTGDTYSMSGASAGADTELMVTYYYTVPVPEPSSLVVLLFVGAGVGMFVIRRRRTMAPVKA